MTEPIRSEREIRIYLDQNVLGLVAEGGIQLTPSADVIWTYSGEHFNEMMRGEPIRFIRVLDGLEAREIIHETGDFYRIEPYVSVWEQFERYTQNNSELAFDEALHFEFFARIFGADNFDRVRDLPVNFLDQIERLTKPYGQPLAHLNLKARKVATRLKEQIETKLDDIPPLTEIRKSLGDSHNRIGDIQTNDPIPEIWELIQPQITGITMDQFFGKKPITAINTFEHSSFSGIVWCHMMLNFLGYRKDTGTHKARKWANILSDGRHTAYGSACDLVLSTDARFCAKATAIYKYFGANAQVAHITIQ